MNRLHFTYMAAVLFLASCNISSSENKKPNNVVKVDSAKAVVDSIMVNVKRALLKELPNDLVKLKVEKYSISLDSMMKQLGTVDSLKVDQYRIEEGNKMNEWQYAHGER